MLLGYTKKRCFAPDKIVPAGDSTEENAAKQVTDTIISLPMMIYDLRNAIIITGIMEKYI
jgi:hypothetical protein